MLRKLNQRLLVNYPLLWNTRVLSMTLLMLLCHLIFFLVGYSTYSSIRHMLGYSRYEYGLQSVSVFMFIGLILFISILIWLIFYLRNNAFKSFYPVSKGYLRLEFLLILFIFFFSFTVFHSYQYGMHVRAVSLAKNLTPEKDAYIENLARHFLPIEISNFEREQCCDTVLARERRTVILPDLPDSCEIDQETGAEYSYPVPPDYEEPEKVMIVNHYSYLYYCNLSSLLGEPNQDKFYFNAIAKRWLQNNQVDSVKWVLSEYAKLMDRYQLKHNFNIDSLTAWCFETPEHSVEYTLNSTNYYDYDPAIQANTGEFYMLSDALDKVHTERQKTFISMGGWEFYFYFAVAFSFLLLMFRLTRLKPWLSAVIGSGIWAIILTIIGANVRSSYTMNIISLVIIIGFAVMAIVLITKGMNKLHAGIWLCWLAFSFLAILPLVAQIILANTGEIRECVNHIWTVTRPELPIHTWINSHWSTINMINIVLGFLFMMFGLIPLAYRWQSNPSE